MGKMFGCARERCVVQELPAHLVHSMSSLSKFSTDRPVITLAARTSRSNLPAQTGAPHDRVNTEQLCRLSGIARCRSAAGWGGGDKNRMHPVPDSRLRCPDRICDLWLAIAVQPHIPGTHYLSVDRPELRWLAC